MKNLRKILCYVLSVLMLSGMLLTAPATANAAETNIQEVGATYSGTTGSCTWNLNTSTGVLSITGTGAMGDYTYSSDAPWYSYRSYVKTVTISNGVTSIGSYAFYYCESLTSVTIPSSITSIGRYAFSWCESLTSITIPSSVTSIGEYVFYNCTSLTSVTIPSSVTSIGNYVFGYCTSLTSVTIPSSVTSIGDYAFYRCTNLTSIDVNSNNTRYSSINGNLYNKDQTTLIQYAIGKTTTSFTIPSSVTSISNSAFSYCKSITSVTIPSGVTSIGYSAFYHCTSLTSVTIPSSVTSIGSWAFYNCESLTSVTIPSSVTSIGRCAFYVCTSLTSINVNSNNTKYSSIDGNLYNKDRTTLIQYAIGKTATSFTIPSSVTDIGSYAFSDCTSLTSVTIPSSVTSIGSWAFSDCTSLTSVTIPSSVTSIGYDAFRDCTSLTSVTIPSSVTSIGSGVFYYCTSLTSVTIPSSVTDIGSCAFYRCTSLTSVTIPSGVTSIDYSAFQYCTNLKTVYYTGTESDWNNISIGSDNTPLTNATIYYSVEETDAQDTSSTTESTESSYETISLNASKTVNISTAGDVKYYQFTPSKSGTYQIYSSGSYDTYGYLYDSNMSQLAYNDDGGVGNNFKISYSLTAGRKYIIGAKLYSSSITGYFNLTVTDGTGSATEATEPTTESTEPTTESSEPTEAPDLIKPTAYISSSNNVASSQTVTLTLSDNVGIAGYYWGTNSNYSSNIFTSTSITSITKTISSPGTYYLTAKDSSGNVSTTQSITFYKTTLNANGGTVSQTTVLTKSGNSFTPPTPTKTGLTFAGWSTSSTATTGVRTITPTSNTTYYAVWSCETISLDVSKTVNISTAGDVKYYQFTPTTSGTYEIYSSGSYDTYGYLYDSNMSQLTYNDDGGSGSNFKISYSLTGGRKYIIGAKFWSSSITGSFTVIVTQKLDDITNPSCSISSTNNVASSQTVTLSLSDNAGIAGYYWGTSSNYSNNTFSSISSTSVTKTISEPGTYYLTAKDISGNVSTTQSITFYRTTLNANGGTVSRTSVLTKSGNSFTPPTPTKTGLTFVGWSTSSTATTGSTSITPTSNTTYYAVWFCETISLNESKTVNISTAGDVKYYQFIPTTSGTYRIYTSGSYDTYGCLYDSNMNQLTYDDDGGSGSNFEISYSLTGGRKYIIGAKLYSSSITGYFNLTVTDDTGSATEPTETTVPTETTQPTTETTATTEPTTVVTEPVETTEPTTESTPVFDYYVVGSPELFGANWTETPANGMTKGIDNRYYLAIENAPAGTFNFKVKDSNGGWHPEGMGNDGVVTTTGGEKVIFRYDPNEGFAVVSTDGRIPTYPVPTQPTESTEPTQPTATEPTETEPTETQATQPTVCTHKSTWTRGKKTATYFTKGYTGDKVCNNCGKVVAKGKPIAKNVLATPKTTIKLRGNSIVISYTKVKNAKGFIINCKFGSQEYTKTVKATKSKTIRLINIKRGIKATVKVRAFTTSGKRKAYSNFTKAKTLRVK